MKKKFLFFLLAIVAGVGTLFAESGECGENLTWNLKNGVLTISGTGEMYDYAALDVPWYSQRESITSLIIGNSVTRIGNEAFYGCSGLTSIEIPNSVTEIGYEAFYGCSGLTSVTIGNNVSTIEYGAFDWCESIIQVTLNSDAIVSKDYHGLPGYCLIDIFGYQVEEYIIGDNVTRIGDNAFGYYAIDEHNLTSVTIGNGVTSIGDEAFYDCCSLTSVNLPEGITRIGYEAFSGCRSLTSITLPESVTSIEDMAFAACTSLTSINIPEGITIIDTGVFQGCGFASINIPQSVTIIAPQAFWGCSSLTSINIPNSVTEIGFQAFSECSSLTSINIPNSVTLIGDNAFSDCSSLTSVNLPEGITRIESNTFRRCSGLTSIEIPNSVTTIGSGAFQDCKSLTSVVLGSGITELEYSELGGGVFYASYENLTSVTCYAINPPTIHELFGDNTIIYVPAESVSAYKSAEYWGWYNTILPIGTTPGTDDIHITPSENSAIIVWKAIANAVSYELVIESGENTWKLVFDAEGILTAMENHAPARYNAPQGIQSADFSYTITGLASGTTYNVTITAKAANGSTLNTETASFTTTGEPHGIEDVNVNNTLSKKIIRDGNVYILRGDKTYTLQGQEVK